MAQLIHMRNGRRRGIIIFDTEYGNTEKIARSLETGLKEAGIQTLCINAKDATPETLHEYDLIAVGAPTQWRDASKPMKEFLQRLRSTDLSESFAFAFDTKLDNFLSGSASKYIERKLQELGLRIIEPRASALVNSLPEKQGGAKLGVLEEVRFHHIGVEIGRKLALSEVITA